MLQKCMNPFPNPLGFEDDLRVRKKIFEFQHTYYLHRRITETAWYSVHETSIISLRGINWRQDRGVIVKLLGRATPPLGGGGGFAIGAPPTVASERRYFPKTPWETVDMENPRVTNVTDYLAYMQSWFTCKCTLNDCMYNNRIISLSIDYMNSFIELFSA